MPKEDVVVEQAREAQRQESKRATLALLQHKKRAEREFTLKLPDGEEVTFLFRAIGAAEYDKLLTKHPPTPDQQAEGADYNWFTFAPALVARVCIDPDIPEAEWVKIWQSPDWNRGETNQLWQAAVSLCNTGFDVVPTEGV